MANANSCDYCNAAHSFIGEKLVNIDTTSIQLAKEGKSNDAKIQAALTFARTLVAKKGRVNSSDLDVLKNEGYSEAAITEIIAHVALNIFTNYFNNATEVAVDFPTVELIESAVV